MKTTAVALAMATTSAYMEEMSPMFGGELIATRSSFPWIVALTDDTPGPDDITCAGSMIDKNLVVTARHCAESTTALVGGMDEKFGVTHVYEHPTADAAILKLSAELESSDFPVRSSSAPEPGSEALHYGWGMPNGEEEYGQLTLRRTAMPVVSDEACETTFDRMIFDHVPVDRDTQLCASIANQPSFASANSGGPLVVDGQLAGLASRGQSIEGHYVFVDLTSIQDFIDDIVEKQRWLSPPQGAEEESKLEPAPLRSSVMHMDDDNDATVSLIAFKRKGSCVSTTSLDDEFQGTYTNVSSGSMCWLSCAESLAGGEDALLAVNYHEEDGRCYCRDECSCIDTTSNASLIMRSDEAMPEVCEGQNESDAELDGFVTFVRTPQERPLVRNDDDEREDSYLLAYEGGGSCSSEAEGEVMAPFANVTTVAACWTTCADSIAGGEKNLAAVNYDEDDGTCQCHETCSCVDEDSESLLVLRVCQDVPRACKQESPFFSFAFALE